MDKDLQRYLNGHLSTAHFSISLIADLADHQSDPAETKFYSDLEGMVTSDHEIMEGLLSSIRCGDNRPQHFSHAHDEKSKRSVFTDGRQNSAFSCSFEALEMLALGIQGKRLLWVALQEISHHFPEWSGIDFQQLEFDAIRQREAVEERRLTQGRKTLTCSIRKNQGVDAPAA